MRRGAAAREDGATETGALEAARRIERGMRVGAEMIASRGLRVREPLEPLLAINWLKRLDVSRDGLTGTRPIARGSNRRGLEASWTNVAPETLRALAEPPRLRELTLGAAWIDTHVGAQGPLDGPTTLRVSNSDRRCARAVGGAEAANPAVGGVPAERRRRLGAPHAGASGRSRPVA